jgi:hypothetical protein
VARIKRREIELALQHGTHCRAARIGPVLLELRNALRRAERCRRVLKRFGFSEQRWLEIVKDVDPNLRFMVRPQILDAIVTHLLSVGEPVGKEELAHKLFAERVESLERIRQSITVSLRSRKLANWPHNKIGLPEWKKRADARKK